MLGWHAAAGSIYPRMLVHGATDAVAMTQTVVLA
jgi:hypothetical protein